ncbi:M56 family metallopeptidase [Pseudohongiella sp.]|uniref:TonB C-terminal domain-containing protein n=1 Tax=marine sediment metagenome TaxID=412755 RepID=A0A0F9W2J6_9ZZZZ|nr:M56 family metallopeptidase [Pseudohongiella sp.]HDZ09782.1 M56 family peptidase [Pseudohongiella sp.]HEA61604.1 M56 family peptidase [Pseudohongiella sp.]
MDNSIWMAEAGQLLATPFLQMPALQLLLDNLVKSVGLLCAFVLIDRLIGRRLGSASRHLVWLNALLCLALLPWLPALTAWWPDSAGAGGMVTPVSLIELTVRPDMSPGTFMQAGTVLLVAYLLPLSLLLGRLIVALYKSRQLFQMADPNIDAVTLKLLQKLKPALGVSRRVQVRISAAIDSPVSFGLLRPVILLPLQARDWNESIMTDVLLHELSHIKRLDWLTTLLAYLVASLYWINPLVWLALRHLRDQSEHSCDSAVLAAGRCDTDYAESLLDVATRCRHARHRQRTSDPLMQPMLDHNSLTIRISHVLEDNKMQSTVLKKQIKRSALALGLISTTMLAALSTTQLLSAQETAAQTQRPAPATRSVTEEMLPIHSETPVYPRVAAEGRIEGWVHVRFTVGADGAVPASSISVIEAEPADIFNNSAVNAAEKFQFRPRTVDGEAVAVDNVQYVFRFKLNDDAADPVDPADPLSSKDPLDTRAPLAPKPPVAPAG